MSKDNVRTLHVATQCGHPDRPMIRLAGKWLQKLGFEPQNKIEVYTGWSELILITKPIDPATLPKLGELFPNFLKS